MILMVPKVKVSSHVEVMECWRSNRTDAQLKLDYQQYILDNFNVLLPLNKIVVNSPKKAA